MIKQRSKEWYSARQGRITASQAGTILGMNPNAKPEDVLKPFNGNDATQWGTFLEPHITAMISQWIPVQEAGFYIHPDHDWLGASPDGFLPHKGVLELKCPFYHRHTPKPIKPHYWAQTQIQMYVTNSDYCAFVQWWPPNQFRAWPILPDNEWLDKSIPKLFDFWRTHIK